MATPETTATPEPPVRVPPPALFPKARLTTVLLSPVSTLPLESSTATVTAGVMVAPAAVVLGPTTKARCLASPVVMSKEEEVAGV